MSSSKRNKRHRITTAAPTEVFSSASHSSLSSSSSSSSSTTSVPSTSHTDPIISSPKLLKERLRNGEILEMEYYLLLIGLPVDISMCVLYHLSGIKNINQPFSSQLVQELMDDDHTGDNDNKHNNCDSSSGRSSSDNEMKNNKRYIMSQRKFLFNLARFTDGGRRADKWLFRPHFDKPYPIITDRLQKDGMLYVREHASKWIDNLFSAFPETFTWKEDVQSRKCKITSLSFIVNDVALISTEDGERYCIDPIMFHFSPVRGDEKEEEEKEDEEDKDGDVLGEVASDTSLSSSSSSSTTSSPTTLLRATISYASSFSVMKSSVDDAICALKASFACCRTFISVRMTYNFTSSTKSAESLSLSSSSSSTCFRTMSILSTINNSIADSSSSCSDPTARTTITTTSGKSAEPTISHAWPVSWESNYGYSYMFATMVGRMCGRDLRWPWCASPIPHKRVGIALQQWLKKILRNPNIGDEFSRWADNQTILPSWHTKKSDLPITDNLTT